MKKNRNLILLISVCIVIFLSILSSKYITPFGDNSFLAVDFFHQYFPMSGELFDRIWNSKSLIYSFNMGIGIPIFRNYFNYLSSPFNILILLFKRTGMLDAYSLIICLKGLVSSICMYFLLKKKMGDKFLLVPISLVYAFSAYYIAYYWNIMWMDGMSFLPLIILGLEKLVDKDKSLLYILSLSLVIYCNYYIGFMICIFVVLYFIMYLFTSKKYNKKELINKSIRFILSSLCVGLLCSFFLIPVYFSTRSISAVEPINLPKSSYYHFKIREFLFNHFSFIESTVMYSEVSNTPNISCGILSLLLIIPFIFNKKINIRIKIGYLSLLFVLGISFFVPQLDYLWHICHVPNDLPYRFSFLYSFVLIIISTYSLLNIKYVDKKYVYLSFLLVIISIIYLNIVGYNYISTIYIVSNYVTVALYLLLYFIYTLDNKNKITQILVFIIIIANIAITININWNMDAKVSTYYGDYINKRTIIDYFEENDSSIFRIGEDEMFTFNDSAWYGFKGLNSFSSMEYKNVAVLMNKLGYPGNGINSYYFTPGNKIAERLFNIKYGFTALYEEYENSFNGSLMFKVDSDIYNWNYKDYDPFVVQNDFIERAYGISNLFKQIESISSETIKEEDNEIIMKYTYKGNNSNFYSYIVDQELKAMIINNNVYNTFDYIINGSSILELGELYYKKYDERFVVEGVNESNTFDIYVISDYFKFEPLVYEIDEEKLKELDESIINNIVFINDFKEHYITGTIEAKEEGTIFTSIPYDIGWKVYIDGKKVNTKMIGNALLGFDIDKGEHTIDLEYHIPYLKVGIILSIISVILLVYFGRKKLL